MKYIDEFRNHELVQKLVRSVHKISRKPVRIMEVCGGHTMAIHRFGIHSLLPSNIELLSGPGCPVCVTSNIFIDRAIAISKLPDTIVATYGDLIRVPGSYSSLEHEKANGADVRIVYSVLDALEIARKNKDKRIIFLGIGFETTTPASAVAVMEAKRQKINNFYLLSTHKTMPNAMMALIDEGISIDAYIGPGHVSTISGSDMYKPLLQKYNLSIVISGFEPVDLLQSIYLIVKQIEQNEKKIEIQYRRAVTPEGNLKAKELVKRAFMPCDDWWRGLGMIPQSGMTLNDEYSQFDAIKEITVDILPPKEPAGCICGDVLKGKKKPYECRLFAKACTPSNPVGTCMVSSEGACHAYYKYDNKR
jgi:hydrogenase expression/formation protein HypD